MARLPAMSPGVTGRRRPLLTSQAPRGRGTIQSPALLALHRDRIAHEFEQFVERSELRSSWVQASKSTNGPPPPTHPADEKSAAGWCFAGKPKSASGRGTRDYV